MVCPPVGARGRGNAAATPPSRVRPLVWLAPTGAYLSRRPGVWRPVTRGATVRLVGSGRWFHFPHVRPFHVAILARANCERGERELEAGGFELRPVAVASWLARLIRYP